MQIVHSSRKGARSIEHIGSAHDDAELAVLKEVARQRLNAGQLSFDLPGLNSENDAGSAPHEPAGAGCVAPIASNRMGVLLEALKAAWKAVGLDRLDGADEVFRQLVTARLIEPTSKQDSLRVLAEAGLSPVSYATVKRHLPSYATEDFTRDLSRLLAGYARIGRASLVLFDVTTLYFETDKADGFREPGFSKERRLEPQITVGLLTDETGFPLRAGAFEGNKAETATMIPMINDFMDAYDLDDVVVVADAGMISAANKQAPERAGLSYVLGSRTSRVPHVISSWHDNHPDQDVPDGLTPSPSPGPPVPVTSAATRPSTTATAPTEPDAPYAGSTPRSPRPRKPSQERSPSNATASCTCPVPPATATWRKGPAPWPGGKATSPTEAHLTIITAALAMARRLETITGWSIKRLISTAFQDGCRLAVDIPYTPPSPQSGAKPAPRALRLRAQTRQHLANLESDTP